jgi:hypothetical protein
MNGATTARRAIWRWEAISEGLAAPATPSNSDSHSYHVLLDPITREYEVADHPGDLHTVARRARRPGALLSVSASSMAAQIIQNIQQHRCEAWSTSFCAPAYSVAPIARLCCPIVTMAAKII